MDTLEYTTPGEPAYRDACAFASQIYAEKLQMQIDRFPDFLFTLSRDTHIVGCIGLNATMHNPVFLKDPKIREQLTRFPNHTSMGEQYLWAVKQHSLGAVMLVSVLSASASRLGIKNVIFTGTKIALRGMQLIGANPESVGPINAAYLDPRDRENCARWFTVYKGTEAYVQRMRIMEELNQAMLKRFGHLFQVGPKLSALLSDSAVEIF